LVLVFVWSGLLVRVCCSVFLVLYGISTLVLCGIATLVLYGQQPLSSVGQQLLSSVDSNPCPLWDINPCPLWATTLVLCGTTPLVLCRTATLILYGTHHPLWLPFCLIGWFCLWLGFRLSFGESLGQGCKATIWVMWFAWQPSILSPLMN
jgi:hypothetical protein